MALLVVAAASAMAGMSPAGACSLASHTVTITAGSTVAPGESISVDVLLFELVPAAERTTTTTRPDEPTIAECPPTRAVAEATFRFVQGDAAIDLVTVQPNDTQFTQSLMIPSSARGGPARIVASVGGEDVAVSDEFTVVATVSPPAPPVIETPTFTG